MITDRRIQFALMGVSGLLGAAGFAWQMFSVYQLVRAETDAYLWLGAVVVFAALVAAMAVMFTTLRGLSGASPVRQLSDTESTAEERPGESPRRAA